MKYYLAGPMSGIPQFNFPLFREATAKLRSNGYEIISPAETDSPEVQAEAMSSPDGKIGVTNKIAGETWAEILAKDVILVGDIVQGIVFLPNWYLSRGAKLEAFVGLLTGKVFGYYIEGKIVDMPRERVQTALREYMP